MNPRFSGDRLIHWCIASSYFAIPQHHSATESFRKIGFIPSLRFYSQSFFSLSAPTGSAHCADDPKRTAVRQVPVPWISFKSQAAGASLY
jgi:hypothetical protein